ncbi:MAG TPA: glycosyltransferase family protein [Isosphaeraceae bacterium]|nr:glycosyltransferase family protein [Isosphaeraceae bacterium]
MTQGTKPRTVAIVQARLGSTRLPGKVLLDLAGAPMLARVVHRVRRAGSLDEVVIATTTEPADDALAALCTAEGWPCFRGSRDDVLDRYYRAALQHQADLVVRVCADCPLIEPAIIDRVVGELRECRPRADYACNVLPRPTYPLGLDVEAFWFETLSGVWREDRNPAWREHVTPFVYHHPARFAIQGVLHDRDLSAMRWTVDTPEDLELMRRIYAAFGHDGFSWQEVLTLLEANPQWLEVNRHIPQHVVQ